MTTADILRTAADRVDQRWGQVSLDNGCALDAIATVITGHSLFAYDDRRTREVVTFAEQALGLRQRGRHESVALCQWNDHPEQTAENVSMGLRYAALIWDEQNPPTPPVYDSIVDALMRLRMEIW